MLHARTDFARPPSPLTGKSGTPLPALQAVTESARSRRTHTSPPHAASHSPYASRSAVRAASPTSCAALNPHSPCSAPRLAPTRSPMAAAQHSPPAPQATAEAHITASSSLRYDDLYNSPQAAARGGLQHGINQLHSSLHRSDYQDTEVAESVASDDPADDPAEDMTGAGLHAVVTCLSMLAAAPHSHKGQWLRRLVCHHLRLLDAICSWRA